MFVHGLAHCTYSIVIHADTRSHSMLTRMDAIAQAIPFHPRSGPVQMRGLRFHNDSCAAAGFDPLSCKGWTQTDYQFQFNQAWINLPILKVVRVCVCACVRACVLHIRDPGTLHLRQSLDVECVGGCT